MMDGTAFPAPGALAGLTVVDLTSHLAGPYCTMLLGDMGADVIKVERPGSGDEARAMPPQVNGMGAPFALWNRNKRSIALDPKLPEDAEVLRRLVARADILVENMRPGALARMGLDWPRASALNERLILCSVSGFGQTGPLASQGGFDLMTQAMAGLMALNGPAAGEPHRLPIAISDVAGGMFACIGVLGALQARERTGLGQFVEASLFESAMAFSLYEAAQVLGTGQRPQRLGQAHRGTAPYQVFRTADGYITVGAGQNGFFRKLCALLGLPGLAEEPRFATVAARVAANGALIAALSPAFAARDNDSWLAALAEAGIPAAPVLHYDEALAHPQAVARGLVAEVPGMTQGLSHVLAPAVKLAATPSAVRRPAPALDEHGAEIREWVMQPAPVA
ncbi:CaiB/BaiF CoA transferase family protein [Siccirubricoccus phaeus]|uniref:CaiB/BaiF CoA transferase family protein n=1 Tax=Siccirubricoccus phaeus TaxID=2595053 RepID=UPI0011F0FFBF|nr:CoA transferase [Siccirubricoccus phaeus]